MKKIFVLLCVGVMAFYLTACGSSSEAPAPTASASSVALEESKISSYDEEKQAILDYMDVAYSGLTPANAPMYFLVSSDGSYAALI